MIGSGLRRFLSQWLRNELWEVRVLGPAKYTQYAWLKHTQRGNPAPQANVPFDIGAPVSILLHDSTVHAVRAHWVASGQGIKELRAFRRVAPRHSTFLDIGAAEGIFSAAFCALTGNQAYAFEPSPTMFGRLRALIELNPDLKIAPFNVALGDTAGDHAVRSHADAQFSAVHAAEATDETMTVETLDSFISRYELTPDFAKIDVEGMELEVLRGGAETFRQVVDVIMLEVHPSMLMRREAVSDIQALLVGFGFELFTVDFTPISDLARHVAGHPELMGGATHIVCQKSNLANS